MNQSLSEKPVVANTSRGAFPNAGETEVVRPGRVNWELPIRVPTSDNIEPKRRIDVRPELSAPVEYPSPVNMTVKLVRADLLSRLEETRMDEIRTMSVGWTFLGAVLGVVVNLATSSQTVVAPITVVTLVAFSIMSLVSFAAAVGLGRRASKTRQQMLEGPAQDRSSTLGSSRISA